jgi:archaellum component FlaC
MSNPEETLEEKLARLEEELKDLKDTLPEHCAGTREYISVHRATPTHWQKIEDIEEEIKKLKEELK